MISGETLEKLARRYQMSVFPNIVREYFQHVFLAELYKIPKSETILFKGGTALHVVYGSPRFSEDLDFTLFGVEQVAAKQFVEDVFIKVLAAIERAGFSVELGEKSDETSGGYLGVATFTILEYQQVGVEINVSARNGRGIRGEVDSIANDFVPTYTLVHLPQAELVEEKIFGALRERKKPRDFYDLYFMMRKGMLSPEQRRRIAERREELMAEARRIDFRGELGAFLPADQQPIIRDFVRALEAELGRQTA
jgi:predicted nucleotidyltransferase component of viral defense system